MYNDQNNMNNGFNNMNPGQPQQPMGQPGFQPTGAPAQPAAPMQQQPMMGGQAQPMMGAQPQQPMGFGQQPAAPMQQQPMMGGQPGPMAQLPKKNNLIIIIGGVVGGIVVLIVLISLLRSCGLGGHKNNTGQNYKASDVSYNCVSEETTASGVKMKTYTDVLFGYKNYQAYMYHKFVMDYGHQVTDDEYAKLVAQLNATECLTDKSKCQASKFTVSLSSVGWDTKVERKDKQIIVTSYQAFGKDQKISSEDKKKSIESLESQGYKCS